MKCVANYELSVKYESASVNVLTNIMSGCDGDDEDESLTMLMTMICSQERQGHGTVSFVPSALGQ